MSVIYNEHNMDGRNVRENCMVCGARLKVFCGAQLKDVVWNRLPFLVWDEKESITICGKCCQKIKVGFMEDLIEITATMEMREVRRQSDTAFKRTTRRALEKQAEEQAKHEREIMAEGYARLARIKE